MKNITQLQSGWKAKHEWTKTHESGLFAMQVIVHGEAEEGKKSSYAPPRYWCSYLLGGDSYRHYDDDKKYNPRVIKNPLTDLIFEKCESFFHELDLDWNGGFTFFEAKTYSRGGESGLRTWKVGDDYTHLWDSEWGRWDRYDFEHVSRNIERVADQFFERIKKHLPGLLGDA